MDKLNNSVRGCKFCEELLKTYAFHRFDNVGGGNPYDSNELPKIDPTYQKSQTAGELQTQILLAAANDDKLALQRYWLRDIDMNTCDYDSRTALHIAASEGNYSTCKFLLEICKVNPCPEDRWKQTPLQEALRFGFPKIAALVKKVMNEHPERVVDASAEADDEKEEELERIPEGEVFEPNRSRRNSIAEEDEQFAPTPRQSVGRSGY